MSRTILILGGTAEARALALALVDGDAIAAPKDDAAGLRVVSSLAGRVSNPAMPVGEVRVGGFGGPAGMVDWYAENDVAAVVDATHPFAEQISANAVEAERLSHIPLLRLARPGWSERSDDSWVWCDSLEDAATWLADNAGRPFITTGRQGIAAFKDLPDHACLIRCVEPPDLTTLPRDARVRLDRGPFTLEGELELMREHEADVVVTKDSGGPLTEAKLAAARELGLPVLVVRRPPTTAATVVAGVDEALTWVADQLP